MIHKYKLGDYFILLDVGSGSIHVIDELTYQMLDYIDPPMDENCPVNVISCFHDVAASEIIERYNELFALYKNKLLFCDDQYSEFRNMMQNAPIKAMCLHVAHDCNLRCKYCFAATGDFGSGRKLMSSDIACQSIDFLISHSGTRHNLELDFFGGEPLMNFDVIKHTVEYARSQEKKHNKHFRFTVTTNGILLDDAKIKYLNENMDNIVLSLDGRKSVNDFMRPRADQTGSYDKIISKYQKLVSERGPKDYYVRGTFTKHNLDFAKDVFHINNCGFDQLSIEPVISDPKEDYAITQQDLPIVFEQYEKLAQAIIEKKKNGSKINFFHFMIDLDQGPCAIKRLRGCGCGNEYIAVTPEGDIYPCHQFVGMEQWKMGSVCDGSLDQEKKLYFSKTTLYDKPECQKCWAKFFCSGGCNANNAQYSGNVYTPYHLGCEMQKKRIECAIMIQAALRDNAD